MIPTKIHGAMDYLVGVVLIVAPWLLGFAEMGAETWIPVIIGAGSILYAVLTDYELGLVKLLSMPVHLGIDVVAGAFLALSPWLFGYAELVFIPHLAVGILMIGAGLLTQRTPGVARRPA